MSDPFVTIFNEYRHERREGPARALYPDGIHGALRAALEEAGGARVATATLDEPEHGLDQARLDGTDVLLWWGHLAHDEVDDAVVERVRRAVLAGMGLVVLHSGHFSKPFTRLLGTHGRLRWREAGEREHLWNLRPDHPILAGIGDVITLEHEEAYGERFDVPEPDELLMLSWFAGGDVFRSVATWRRGFGRIVYVRPGHETYPTYHHPEIRRLIVQAAHWAAARVRRDEAEAPQAEPLEPLDD